LPLSCEVIQKGVFGPRFVEGGDTPDFGHAFSNRSYFRACGRFWLSSVQRARKLGGEKKREKKKEKRKKKERVPVKYKSVDMYVGRPNEKKEKD